MSHPFAEVSPASPHALWGAIVRLGWREDAAVLGAWDYWLRQGKTLPPTRARTTSCLSFTHWGKAVWFRSVCLHAAVAIAWPPALIILMAFHTLGEVIKDSVTRHGLLLAW